MEILTGERAYDEKREPHQLLVSEKIIYKKTIGIRYIQLNSDVIWLFHSKDSHYII